MLTIFRQFLLVSNFLFEMEELVRKLEMEKKGFSIAEKKGFCF